MSLGRYLLIYFIYIIDFYEVGVGDLLVNKMIKMLVLRNLYLSGGDER